MISGPRTVSPQKGSFINENFNVEKDPDGEIENSGKKHGKSRIPNVCYIQVIVFDLSPNPLLMYSANVKNSENPDRWLAALSSSIVH